MQTLASSLNFTTTILACKPPSSTTHHRRRSRLVENSVAPPLSTSHNHRKSHSLPPEKIELFKSLEPWAAENVLTYLTPVERSWQPSDFLPDPTRPFDEFMDEVRALRERTNGLSDDYFVVLVGDMVTEEALPTYHAAINSLVGVGDDTGSSPNPWATWVRRWTSEEKRHGDLLKGYLYLSGRVDMLMVERTVQYLIGAGMDHSNWEANPYLGFVYTSFQERATFVSHCNTARLASEGGDPTLAKICGIIAADEKHHENAYCKIIEKLLEVDPNEAMVAIGKMLRSRIIMPAAFMYDGRDPHLFEHFAHVANRIGVYSSHDYVEILESLIAKWKLEKLEGLKSDGKYEQEMLCNLPSRLNNFLAWKDQSVEAKGFEEVKFKWIFNSEMN